MSIEIASYDTIPSQDLFDLRRKSPISERRHLVDPSSNKGERNPANQGKKSVSSRSTSKKRSPLLSNTYHMLGGFLLAAAILASVLFGAFYPAKTQAIIVPVTLQDNTVIT